MPTSDHSRFLTGGGLLVIGVGARAGIGPPLPHPTHHGGVPAPWRTEQMIKGTGPLVPTQPSPYDRPTFLEKRPPMSKRTDSAAILRKTREIERHSRTPGMSFTDAARKAVPNQITAFKVKSPTTQL